MSVPVVAIIGRPNVGKSMLFNRLVKARIAIVEETPGVTRDRVYGRVRWQGREFTFVDTGGLAGPDEGDPISEAVRRQVETAIDEAQLVLFVVDARSGVVPGDEEVATILRSSRKPVILVANKAEGKARERSEHLEFYALGFGEPLPVSAAEGYNIAELLDRVASLLPPGEAPEEPAPKIAPPVRIAVVGRPNVGKSSLVNALLGQEKSIVTHVPGTTRDAIDSPFSYKGQDFIIIDTAGLRRKSRIKEDLEYYSIKRALAAIDRSDVCILMVDATLGVRDQETKIAGYIKEAGKASVIAVNKWDLIPKSEGTSKEWERAIREHLDFISYSPIVFISALTRERIWRVMDQAISAFLAYSGRVDRNDLQFVISDAVTRMPPPAARGRPVRIFEARQVGAKPPRIALEVNDPELVARTYLRYLENRLREAFDFSGTPIKIVPVARRKESL